MGGTRALVRGAMGCASPGPPSSGTCHVRRWALAPWSLDSRLQAGQIPGVGPPGALPHHPAPSPEPGLSLQAGMGSLGHGNGPLSSAPWSELGGQRVLTAPDPRLAWPLQKQSHRHGQRRRGNAPPRPSASGHGAASGHRRAEPVPSRRLSELRGSSAAPFALARGPVWTPSHRTPERGGGSSPPALSR